MRSGALRHLLWRSWIVHFWGDVSIIVTELISSTFSEYVYDNINSGLVLLPTSLLNFHLQNPPHSECKCTYKCILATTRQTKSIFWILQQKRQQSILQQHQFSGKPFLVDNQACQQMKAIKPYQPRRQRCHLWTISTIWVLCLVRACNLRLIYAHCP